MGGFPHYNGFYLPLFGDNGEMAQNYFSWVKNGSQGDKLFFIWGGGVLGLPISDSGRKLDGEPVYPILPTGNLIWR